MKKSSKNEAKPKKTPEEIVNDIQDCCKLLGWNLAMNESSNIIKGLIIGKLEYVEAVVHSLEDAEEYSIYSSSQSIDSEMH